MSKRIKFLTFIYTSILMFSCNEEGKNILTQEQKNQLDVNTAIREYLNVIGRQPRDKGDLITFYIIRTDSIIYYQRVVELMKEVNIQTECSDSVFCYEYNRIKYYVPYEKKDICYCDGSYCSNLKQFRKQIEQIKTFWLSSRMDSLNDIGLFFNRLDVSGKTVDVTFINRGDGFEFAKKPYNRVVISTYSGFANTFDEVHGFSFVDSDSIALRLIMPEYHESPPPPPPM